MGRSAENPIRLDEEKDKENSPPTTPVADILSAVSTRTPKMLRSCLIGNRMENVPEYVYRDLFECVLQCRSVDMK